MLSTVLLALLAQALTMENNYNDTAWRQDMCKFLLDVCFY